MRLVTSSTSLAAALTASQALVRDSWILAVASDVDYAYDLEVKQSGTNKLSTLDKECSYPNSIRLRGNNIDAGILHGCNDPDDICVEDVNSSLGGRCVSASAAKHRMLKDTPNPCTKCDDDGCIGLSQDFKDNNIGEGSCCGIYACKGVSENTIIGEGSCIGYRACYGIDAIIGSRSCTGDSIRGPKGYFGFSCSDLKGTVGNNSCIEYASCNQKDWADHRVAIGDHSCTAPDSCEYISTYNDLEIGDRSCTFNYACGSTKANISDYSCLSVKACFNNTGTIGKNSCIEDFGCYENSGDVSDDSCKWERACFNNAGIIGKNSCNNIRACENNKGDVCDNQCNDKVEVCKDNDVTITCSPTTAPTKLPTSAPTKVPTKSPTNTPTKAPSKRPTSAPTKAPSKRPTSAPTKAPSKSPTSATTKAPSKRPTSAPTEAPTKHQTSAPSVHVPDAPGGPTPTSKSSKKSKNAKGAKRGDSVEAQGGA